MLTKEENSKLNFMFFNVGICTPAIYYFLSFFNSLPAFRFEFSDNKILIIRITIVLCLYSIISPLCILKYVIKRKEKKKDKFGVITSRTVAYFHISDFPATLGMCLSFYFDSLMYSSIGTLIALFIAPFILSKVKSNFNKGSV